MTHDDLIKAQRFGDAMGQSFPIQEAHTPDNQIDFGIAQITTKMKLELGLIQSEEPSPTDFTRPNL